MKSLPAIVVSALLAVLLFFACGETATESTDPVAPAAEADADGVGTAEIDSMLIEGRYAEVVSALQPRLDAGRCSADEALRLAIAREGQDEVPKAETVLREALVKNPGAVELSLRLARLYQGLGLPEKSLSTLEAARAAGASDEDLALELAVLKGILQDFEGAEAELERARAAGAPATDIEYNLAVLATARGDLPGAEALLQGIVDRGEAPTHVRRELARARLDQAPGDRERAIEVRDAVNSIEGLDEDWRYWEILGDCEMVFGDAQAAKAYYYNALKYGQNPPRIEGKYRRAARALQEELEAAGILPEPEKVKRAAPPVGANFEEQNRLAREARERAEKEAQKVEKEGPDGE